MDSNQDPTLVGSLSDAEHRRHEAELDALALLDGQKRRARHTVVGIGVLVGILTLGEFLYRTWRRPLWSPEVTDFLLFLLLAVCLFGTRAAAALYVRLRMPSWTADLAARYGVPQERLLNAGPFEEDGADANDSVATPELGWRWWPF